MPNLYPGFGAVTGSLKTNTLGGLGYRCPHKLAGKIPSRGTLPLTLELPLLHFFVLLILFTASFYNGFLLHEGCIIGDFKHCHPVLYPLLKSLLEPPSPLGLGAAKLGHESG